jgi:DNA-binding GntR family transcriptional regulator
LSRFVLTYGAFIAKVSRQEIREVYEIRRLLEAEIVRQVTALMPESVLDELDRLLTETQAQFEAGDSAKHFESDNRISIVRRFAQLQPGPHLVKSFKEHRAILQAMRERDPEEAAELMRVHLVNSAVRIKELSRDGPV